MRCPACGLENVSTAEHCDCGYALRGGRPVRHSAPRPSGRASAGFYAFSILILFSGVLAIALGGFLLFAGDTTSFGGVWWMIGSGLGSFWFGWLGVVISDLAEKVGRMA